MARAELERQCNEKQKLQEFQKQLTGRGRGGWWAQRLGMEKTGTTPISLSAPGRAVFASGTEVAEVTGAGRVVDAAHGICRTRMTCQSIAVAGRIAGARRAAGAGKVVDTTHGKNRT